MRQSLFRSTCSGYLPLILNEFTEFKLFQLLYNDLNVINIKIKMMRISNRKLSESLHHYSEVEKKSFQAPTV